MPLKAYEGRINYRAEDGQPVYDPPALYILSRAGMDDAHPITVDGQPVEQCWYADTKEGVAKCYVHADGRPGPEAQRGPVLPAFPGREFEIIRLNDDTWLLSEIRRGKVEIWGDEE
jgi:hypothetical protein